MEKVTLNAVQREHLGKGACKQLRKEGMIPAVVYKGGKEGMVIQVDSKELWKALHTEAGENAIIEMKIKSGDKTSKKTVIVQEKQRDPVTDVFLHVDFHEISLKEKLKVKVPVSTKGEPVGVKEDKGILSQTIWEIEVECLPTEIPEHVDVKVEELRIGDSIHVKDITIPGDIVILDDPEKVIVSVIPPKAEEVEEEEGELEEGEVEPEVIKKGKQDEEEGEEAPEAPSGE